MAVVQRLHGLHLSIVGVWDAVSATERRRVGSAIGIAFPAFAAVLDRWRERMVGARIQGIPPHVSLLVPWRLSPLTADDVAAVAATVGGIKPFAVSFRRLDRFDAAHVLFLHPEPAEPFLELTQRLVRAFSETPPYGGTVTDPTPHLTVTVASACEDLDQLANQVWQDLAPHLPLESIVRDLTVAEEQPNGSWQSTHVIPLSSME